MPTISTVDLGSQFDVVIQVQAGGQQVDGGAGYLDFDPTILQVVSITAGTTLPVVLSNSFNNSAGTLNYAAAIFSGFPTGNFTLATVRFSAIALSAGTPLTFHLTPEPRVTIATFGGGSVFDHAVDGIVIVSAGATAATATPTPLTPTPTVTPTATPRGAAIHLSSATGSPGDQVAFSATLDTGGAIVGSAQNDITFDSANAPVAALPDGTPDCAANPALNKDQLFVFRPNGCTGAMCTTVRTAVFKTSPPISPIPDGSVLYTCKVAIAPNATPGEYPLVISRVQLTNPSGMVLPSSGSDGKVIVLTQLATATPQMQVPTSTPTLPPTSTPSSTMIPTSTKTPTANPTPVATPTVASTRTLTGTATFTPSPTSTAMPTATPTTTHTTTSSPTLPPTALPSATPTDTSGATPSLTNTPTTTTAQTATPTLVSCIGDCNGSREVTVNELITMVNIALDNGPLSACRMGDANSDGQITVDEILKAVGNGLNGCS